jgi:hypothetical protein
MGRQFRLETETWSANGFSTQKLDISQNLKSLSLELDVQYDTAASVTRLKDGFATQLIDFLRVRDGSNIPIELYGEDIAFAFQLFAKMAHSFAAFTTAASQTDQKVKNKFVLPIEFDKALYTRPVLEIQWANAAAIGTGYTIDLGTLNGTYMLTNAQVDPYKLIPDISKVNVTGTQRIQIPSEGALTKILIIAYENASPNARRNALSTIQTRIEGIVDEVDADTALLEYAKISETAEQTGVYLFDLIHRPQIGTNSWLYLNGDSVGTDYHVYFVYVPRTVELIKPVEIIRQEPIARRFRIRAPLIRGLRRLRVMPRFP